MSERRALVKNAADEEQVKEAEIRQKDTEKQAVDDLKKVLSLREGRRLIWRWLGFCGLDKQSADASGSWTYFNEGQRKIGLQLKGEILKASEEAYLQMQLEAFRDSKGE